jgi:ribosomal protein S12 methylthiotransferase accessory factor
MNHEPSRVISFHRHFDVQVVDDEGVYLISERDMIQLSGRLAAAIAPRLNGTLSLEQLVSQLPNIPEDVVRSAIAHLIDNGLAAEETPDFFYSEPDTSFYEATGIDRRTAIGRLTGAKIFVHAVGDVTSSGVISHLKDAGVGEVNAVQGDELAQEEVSLYVVLTDDYRRPELRRINEACLASGQRWLLARSVGTRAWIGPVFRPQASACWACLVNRLEANAEGHAYLQAILRPGTPVGTSRVRNSVATAAAAALIAMECLNLLVRSQEGASEIRTVDFVTGHSEQHAVTRRPQCPICGDPGLMAAQAVKPILFEARPKAAVSDGGHRSESPDEVIERYRGQVSSLTGVVRSIDRVHISDTPLWVFVSGQNLARKADNIRNLEHGLRSASAGKGMTESQARASAMGEAIERSSGVFQGDELRSRGRMSDFDGDAIHPNACLLYSARQHEFRHLWNLGESNFRAVSEPFDEQWSIDWSPVWSVTANKPRWLPTQYLYYGYPVSETPWMAFADSNGAAAGSSLEDATLQGFCELIERDSVAIWWYNRALRPSVDLDSFREPYLDRLRETYLNLGREVWALDLTSDFGIPAIAALSRLIDGDSQEILFAFGAHLDPRIALLRAMNEMNQFLTAVIPGRDGKPRDATPEAEFTNWCQVATLENQPYLVPDAAQEARQPGSWPSLPSDNLGDDLTLCRRLVEERGMELLVLNQTRPDVGLPVVKVIVPGLRHYWPRYAPGRLFDVPVQLGWQRDRTAEEDLNPIPIFV